jgi:hypothetical protein
MPIMGVELTRIGLFPKRLRDHALVIRNAEGEVRWMEVRDYLKHASDNGKKPVRQIVFAGERFDVMSVRGWRDRALRQGVP